MNNNIFRRILNENFDDDYADYQRKKDDYEALEKRSFDGEATLNKFSIRKMTFEFYGKKYYLMHNYNSIDVFSLNGHQLATVGANDINKQIQEIAQAVYEDAFGERISDMSLWDCFTAEDFDHLEKTAKLYKELLGIVTNQKSKYDDFYSDEGEFNKLKKVATNRYNKAQNARDVKLAAKKKARKSLYDETPDIEEGGYAIWHSDNGDRRVTVLSIDEPNQKVKIKTDGGAIRNVPIDDVDKDVDYDKYF